MDQTLDGGADISISVLISCILLPATAKYTMPTKTNPTRIVIIFFIFSIRADQLTYLKLNLVWKYKHYISNKFIETNLHKT